MKRFVRFLTILALTTGETILTDTKINPNCQRQPTNGRSGVDGFPIDPRNQDYEDQLYKLTSWAFTAKKKEDGGSKASICTHAHVAMVKMATDFGIGHHGDPNHKRQLALARSLSTSCFRFCLPEQRYRNILLVRQERNDVGLWTLSAGVGATQARTLKDKESLEIAYCCSPPWMCSIFIKETWRWILLWDLVSSSTHFSDIASQSVEVSTQCLHCWKRLVAFPF